MSLERKAPPVNELPAGLGNGLKIPASAVRFCPEPPRPQRLTALPFSASGVSTLPGEVHLYLGTFDRYDNGSEVELSRNMYAKEFKVEAVGQALSLPAPRIKGVKRGQLVKLPSP